MIQKKEKRSNKYNCGVWFLIAFLYASFVSGQGNPANVLPKEEFSNISTFSNSSTVTTKFCSPSTCTTGGLKYYSSGGCTGGYIGFSGASNNFFGCYLRTPPVNCKGHTIVKLKFDISNSFIASHQNSVLSMNDRIHFYMYVDGKYMNAGSILINNVSVGQTDINGIYLKFDSLRVCVPVEVEFDLSSCKDLSKIYFYLEPACAYNDNEVFSVSMDNISVE